MRAWRRAPRPRQVVESGWERRYFRCIVDLCIYLLFDRESPGLKTRLQSGFMRKTISDEGVELTGAMDFHDDAFAIYTCMLLYPSYCQQGTIASVCFRAQLLGVFNCFREFGGDWAPL